ncbi:hypothetical protein BDV95DRAFT_138132 [Massariosphaeria phaeospora]|uniref:Uncharacterized protein n=1 Tax=Massariosphaeria phaeospora TaxID=100035 RepID=A0A7C8IDN0_9PLEO|nr:hypothetical protein BDV95DRAFT_138132 [Massariosphaeria phaeospora]
MTKQNATPKAESERRIEQTQNTVYGKERNRDAERGMYEAMVYEKEKQRRSVMVEKENRDNSARRSIRWRK